MVAVAVVALLMGAGLGLGRRSRRFARLSEHHANAALEHFHTVMALGGGRRSSKILPSQSWRGFGLSIA
jgi:hypothetical protein